VLTGVRRQMLTLIRKRMKTFSLTAALLLLLCLSSGCVELHQKLVWHADDSGDIWLDYRVPLALWPSLLAAQTRVQSWQDDATTTAAKPTAAELAWWFNEAQVRQFCRQAGVRLVQYERRQTALYQQVLVHCRAADLPKVLANGAFGTFNITRTDNGLVKIKAVLAETDAAPAPLSEQRRRQLEALCQGLRLQLQIQVPGRIETSSATTVTEQQASWEFDADADPGFLHSVPRIELSYMRQ